MLSAISNLLIRKTFNNMKINFYDKYYEKYLLPLGHVFPIYQSNINSQNFGKFSASWLLSLLALKLLFFFIIVSIFCPPSFFCFFTLVASHVSFSSIQVALRAQIQRKKILKIVSSVISCYQFCQRCFNLYQNFLDSLKMTLFICIYLFLVRTTIIFIIF